MPQTIIDVDGTDLFPYLRVAPGEGFDPADPDFMEPQFGDAVGLGDPLLSIAQHNREIAIPVHLRSPVTALTNEVTNPNMEVDLTGWAIAPAGTTTLTTGARQTDWSSKGRASIRFTASVGASGAVNFVNATIPSTVTSPAAAPGEVWQARVNANILSNTSQIVMTINWFTAANAFISTASTTYAAGTTGERILQASGTAPATTAKCNLTVQISSVIGSVDMYFDNASLVKSTTPVATFSGSDLYADWNGAAYNSSSTTYSGKDGLTSTISKLHQVLNQGKVFAWRDEGLSDITSYDIQFARFEAEYNYRRTQKYIQSGIIRIFAKPFGHTGTMRGGIGSAVGTGVTVSVPLGTQIMGDQLSDLEVLVRSASQVGAPKHPAYVQGYSIVPSGYAYDIPAASMTLFTGGGTYGSPSLGAASGGAGSQAIYFGSSQSALADPDAFFRLAQVNLSPASMYAGRNRVLGVVSMRQYPGPDFRAYLVNTGNPLGPPVCATVHADRGWGLVDFGTFNPVSNRQATISLRIEANLQGAERSGAGQQRTNNIIVSRELELNRILVLPENSTVLTVNSKRALVGYDSFDDHGLSSLNSVVDRLGNSYSTPVNATAGLINAAAGVSPTTSANGWQRGDAQVLTPTYINWSMEAYGQFQAMPSSAIVLAKMISYLNQGAVGPVVRYANNHLAIGRAGMDMSIAGADTFVNVASTALASYSGDFGLRTTMVGAEVFAEVFAGASLVATISASHSTFEVSGWPAFGVVGTVNSFGIYGVRYNAISSIAIAPRDEFLFSSLLNTVDISNASVYRESGDMRVRGAIPKATSANYYNLIGIQIPMSGGLASDRLEVEVYARENFTYAR